MSYSFVQFSLYSQSDQHWRQVAYSEAGVNVDFVPDHRPEAVKPAIMPCNMILVILVPAITNAPETPTTRPRRA
jgi:hypothetical protein